jgi:sugar lactone lactonase YvrE
MNKAELLFYPSDAGLRFLPEGPYPIADGRFSWVAIQHGGISKVGSVNVFDLRTKTNTTHELPGRPGFAFPTNKGRFVVGCERMVGLFTPGTSEFQVIAQGIDEHVSGTIINDGLTWDGNLIFGTKDLEFKTKKASLNFWRARDQKLFVLRNDQICSNGKCIAATGPDWIELLDIDSPTRKVVKYRINTEAGRIESEQTVVDLSYDEAVPDGMTMTLDGKSVIISLYNPNPAAYGRTIQVSLATGKLETEWCTEGSPQATCPQWVTLDGNLWLVITTAVEFMPAERQAASPHAGGLFAVPFGKLKNSQAFERITPLFIEP